MMATDRRALYINALAPGGYDLNRTRHWMSLSSLRQGFQRAAKLLTQSFPMASIGLILLIAQSVKPQQLTVRTLSPGGEEWRYTMKSWQLQDGLPEATVQAFAQTPDGYLWVGTTGGLIRFDGERFRLFNHENTPAFVEDNVFCLQAAQDGRLWIGTGGGGLIEMSNGTFHAYPVEGGPGVHSSVQAIAGSRDGVLLVATGGGLFFTRNGRLERVGKSSGLPILSFDAMLEDHAGRTWVGGERLFSLKGDRVREYSLPGHDSRNHVKSLLETSDGVIWVGTVSGLYRLRQGQDHLEPVPGVSGTIRALREVPGGELWVGATSGGIFRISGEHVTRLRAPSPLISNTVYSIFIDAGGNLWIGTLVGFMRLSPTPVRLLPLPEATQSDYGTVALDRDDSLWAASNKLVHIQGNRAYLIRFPALGNIRVRNLLRSRDGSLWVGTIGGGVYRFSSLGTKHFTAKDGLPSNFVQVILEARDGTLWIGCDSGLSRLDQTGLHNLNKQNGLPSNMIRALLEDSDGTIWIGTDRGVRIYRNGEFAQNEFTTALGDGKAWALHQDADRGMWAGMLGHGLYRYFKGRLSHYTTANGLISNDIYCILEDKQKHLWLSSPSGVMLLNRDELDAQAGSRDRPFSQRYYAASEDGASVRILGGEQSAGVLTKTGEAWFPTNLGLWRIRPDELKHPLLSKLNVDAVTVDGRPEPLAGRVKLNADSSRVEIAYEPVWLRSQDELRFRYRLDGFEQNWTYASAQERLATYTNLPAGKYTFLAEAWETDHPEHVARASMDILKTPHFFQTPWFIVSCVLAVMMLSFFAHRVRIEQINGRFKAVLGERTRLAREIHDTVIQGCIGVSTLLQAASTAEIDNESQAQLIDYAAEQIHATVDEARQAVWDLRSKEAGKSDIQMMLKQMAERIGREYDLELNYSTLGRSYPISMQTVHDLMMVARESIFNAILHGRARRVSVQLSFIGESISLIVEDNGNGFDDAMQVSEGHFGLSGIKERIERYDGRCQVNSAIGMGTRIVVEIPRAAIALH